MREQTDVNEGLRYFIRPGHYEFEVVKAEVGYTTGLGKKYYQFTFSYDNDKVYEQRFMVWLVAPLLEALGYVADEKGIYDWDTEEVKGKTIAADIVLEEYTKKDGTIKTKPAMVNIEGLERGGGVPF